MDGCQRVTIAELDVGVTGLEGVQLVSEADSSEDSEPALGKGSAAKKRGRGRVQGEVATDTLIIESKAAKRFGVRSLVWHESGRARMEGQCNHCNGRRCCKLGAELVVVQGCWQDHQRWIARPGRTILVQGRTTETLYITAQD